MKSIFKYQLINLIFYKNFRIEAVKGLKNDFDNKIENENDLNNQNIKINFSEVLSKKILCFYFF